MFPPDFGLNRDSKGKMSGLVPGLIVDSCMSLPREWRLFNLFGYSVPNTGFFLRGAVCPLFSRVTPAEMGGFFLDANHLCLFVMPKILGLAHCFPRAVLVFYQPNLSAEFQLGRVPVFSS